VCIDKLRLNANSEPILDSRREYQVDPGPMRVWSPLRVRLNLAPPRLQCTLRYARPFRNSSQRTMREPPLNHEGLEYEVQYTLLDCLAVVAVLSLANAWQFPQAP